MPDTEVFKTEPSGGRPTGDGFRLVIVSTLVKRYGVQTVVKAVPLVVPYIPELQVDIVGGGNYLPELQKMARDLKVEKIHLFQGHRRL